MLLFLCENFLRRHERFHLSFRYNTKTLKAKFYWGNFSKIVCNMYNNNLQIINDKYLRIYTYLLYE